MLFNDICHVTCFHLFPYFRSRLGCQITVTKDMDGMTVTVPESVADARDV